MTPTRCCLTRAWFLHQCVEAAWVWDLRQGMIDPQVVRSTALCFTSKTHAAVEPRVSGLIGNCRTRQRCVIDSGYPGVVDTFCAVRPRLCQSYKPAQPLTAPDRVCEPHVGEMQRHPLYMAGERMPSAAQCILISAITRTTGEVGCQLYHEAALCTTRTRRRHRPTHVETRAHWRCGDVNQNNEWEVVLGDKRVVGYNYSAHLHSANDLVQAVLPLLSAQAPPRPTACCSCARRI